MSILLSRLSLKNYRAWESLDISLGDINVLFGPNGAGKSSCLDGLLFLHDCLVRDVPFAASQRSQGIGLLYNRAREKQFEIGVGTGKLNYSIRLQFHAGLISPLAGEKLEEAVSTKSQTAKSPVIQRICGTKQASFAYEAAEIESGQKPEPLARQIMNALQETDGTKKITLREPKKLSVDSFIDSITPSNDIEVELFGNVYLLKESLESMCHFYSRDVQLSDLKTTGARAGTEMVLSPRSENLWSVLRNLHDRRGKDKRYNTIIELMRECIPTFDDLYFEQTGAASLYGGMIEIDSPEAIPLIGMSDGHIQMLIHLAALFGMEPETSAILLFDEPEASLHPWALATLAKAMKTAAHDWNRQIILATHSPVLLSQFEPEETLAFEIGDDGRKRAIRVSEMKDIQDLLEHYATGSLYMAEAVAPQSRQAGGNPE